ncbi:hypothetical protein COO91_08548 [Nostoc flagelliforme CCNUN1]|uniref:Uncharacterized protein n=1 Tax=Nostoc flagelliforme CCNUN1 TaxID=2038116 RepID=A0A2K8T474_9NOSO|nr:hypothetical protein [Nostoc flagelliforme]AUB42420.1 hypothetical protein COO91_08548 [Nostoc flagelliforme CCNUN1]
MANIKIAELQSSLLEELSATDLEAVHGGQAPGIQAVGSTSAVGVGFSNGGSTGVSTESSSFLSGNLGNFTVQFGSFTNGFTSPR